MQYLFIWLFMNLFIDPFIIYLPLMNLNIIRDRMHLGCTFSKIFITDKSKIFSQTS